MQTCGEPSLKSSCSSIWSNDAHMSVCMHMCVCVCMGGCHCRSAVSNGHTLTCTRMGDLCVRECARTCVCARLCVFCDPVFVPATFVAGSSLPLRCISWLNDGCQLNALCWFQAQPIVAVFPALFARSQARGGARGKRSWALHARCVCACVCVRACMYVCVCARVCLCYWFVFISWFASLRDLDHISDTLPAL